APAPVTRHRNSPCSTSRRPAATARPGPPPAVPHARSTAPATLHRRPIGMSTNAAGGRRPALPPAKRRAAKTTMPATIAIETPPGDREASADRGQGGDPQPAHRQSNHRGGRRRARRATRDRRHEKAEREGEKKPLDLDEPVREARIRPDPAHAVGDPVPDAD